MKKAMEVAQRLYSKLDVNLCQASTTGDSSLEGTMQPMSCLFCDEEGQNENILKGITGRSMGYMHIHLVPKLCC